MKAPDFWWDRSPGVLARLLLPFGALYGAITAHRMAGKGLEPAVPVICIGNFTAGGAGKTPTALALAEALMAHGERPVFLSRGYGGTEAGPLLVETGRHSAAEVGDEPLLLARLAPTIIARDRLAGAHAAVAAGASLIIMDDGLQNPALQKDIAIAVVDGGAGFGNGLSVPAGPLRAPVRDQSRHVDALLAIGMGKGITEAVGVGAAAGKPVFRSNFSVDDAVADRLGGTRVLAFTGIGRPQKFFETLVDLYAKIEGAHPFPDHHAFTDAEATMLLEAAKARALLPVTTEKDLARLTGTPARDALRQASFALPIRLPLPEGLVTLVVEKLSACRARRQGTPPASHMPPGA
ncbi:MAG: tetraacyldisaccharide 4'-kinase [Proteobacteria bacterium]|nr:tetraacyldisaccharide 4'-kinase [Pseudomonadota bacterium]